MSAPPAPAGEDRLNLKKLAVLLVVPSAAEQDLLVQVLTGFGVRDIRRAYDEAAARGLLAQHGVDLVIVDGSAAEGRACDFVSWLRRSTPEPLRFLPVMMLNGHVRASQVFRARDCGANFVITKPLSARTLLDRIAWLGRERRGFLAVAGGYVGPDRRFQANGPPEGVAGRRREDREDSLEAEARP